MVRVMGFLYFWKDLFTKSFIDVGVKSGVRRVKGQLKRVLREADIEFREDVKVGGSLEWVVDFEVPGRDVVIVCCEVEGEAWEKYIECQDIVEKTGKTCILVMAGPWTTVEMMRLAAIHGVIIVDHESMDKIPSIILGEVWSGRVVMKPPKIRGKTPRRVAEECRRDVLALLSSRPLTRSEIVEALSGRYPERTVEWCISKLRAMGVIRVLGRTAGDGRAIYAATNLKDWGEAMERYMPSKAWIREMRRRRVMEVLRQADGWISTRQIAEATGMSIPQTIAVLRSLMGRGILMQKRGGEVTLWKIIEGRIG